ncbi:MAG: HEAT repeat domain-containing protein [Planctomycetaceae bacterium]
MPCKPGTIAVVLSGLTLAFWLSVRETEPIASGSPHALVTRISRTVEPSSPKPASSSSAYLFSVQDDPDADGESTDADDSEMEADAAAEGAGDEATKENEEALEDSPFLVQPDTPLKLFGAVELMMDLGRPNLAKSYLKKLLKSNPTDDDLQAMRDKYGPAAFLKLANNEDMQPESVELLELFNAAAIRQADNPERVAGLIKDLLEAQPFERKAAIQQLRSAGPRVIPLLIKAIPTLNSTERDTVLLAVSETGETAIPPLVAALESEDETLQNFAIDALGLVGNQETIPHLWYYASDPQLGDGTRQAARVAISRIMRVPLHKADDISLYGAAEGLRDQARNRFRAMTLGTTDSEENQIHWSWDPQSANIVSKTLPVETIALLEGTRFARQALALAPEHREAQILFMSLALASDAMLAGWDQPLPAGPGTAHDLALSSGSELITEVLELAMNEGNPAVAITALNVLKNIASRHDLGSRDGKPSAMVSALNFPDRRVQFVAANAILHLDPEKPYRGAQRVIGILQRSLEDTGGNVAVIIDANDERGGKFKSFVKDSGFEAVVSPTGKEGFTLAAERTDVELILLHANTIQWNLSQTLANLRADARTASIPLIVYGDIELRAKILDHLKMYPQATYIVESSSVEDFQHQVNPFLAQRRTPPLSAELKQQQQVAAIDWMVHIANSRRTEIYDLTPVESTIYRAAENPQLTEGVILILGSIPTQTAQTNLAELVLNDRLTNAQREIAALQMVFHIQRYSLTLSDATLSQLKTLLATTDDPALKTALTALQGALKPNAQELTERLQSFSSTLPATNSAPVVEGEAVPVEEETVDENK